MKRETPGAQIFSQEERDTYSRIFSEMTQSSPDIAVARALIESLTGEVFVGYTIDDVFNWLNSQFLNSDWGTNETVLQPEGVY